MLSSVTINCQIIKIVMNSGSQLSQLWSVSQISQVTNLSLSLSLPLSLSLSLSLSLYLCTKNCTGDQIFSAWSPKVLSYHVSKHIMIISQTNKHLPQSNNQCSWSYQKTENICIEAKKQFADLYRRLQSTLYYKSTVQMNKQSNATTHAGTDRRPSDMC